MHHIACVHCGHVDFTVGAPPPDPKRRAVIQTKCTECRLRYRVSWHAVRKAWVPYVALVDTKVNGESPYAPGIEFLDGPTLGRILAQYEEAYACLKEAYEADLADIRTRVRRLRAAEEEAAEAAARLRTAAAEAAARLRTAAAAATVVVSKARARGTGTEVLVAMYLRLLPAYVSKGILTVVEADELRRKAGTERGAEELILRMEAM